MKIEAGKVYLGDDREYYRTYRVGEKSGCTGVFIAVDGDGNYKSFNEDGTSLDGSVRLVKELIEYTKIELEL